MALLTDVIIYTQLLGIALGLGAQTVALAAYLQAIRDGIIDNEEAQFKRASAWVLRAGLFLIVVSGVGSAILDLNGATPQVVFEPAYLFKWAIIALTVVLSIPASRRVFVAGAIEGVAGAAWYALFLVHVSAPVTTWFNLLTLGAVWLAGFNLCWWALVLLLAGKKADVPKKIDAIAAVLPPKFVPPKPIAPSAPPAPVKPLAVPPTNPVPVAIKPPAAPKPAMTVPATPSPSPTPVAVPKPEVPPITDPDKNPGLPAIQVMPKTKDDLETQNRASVVKFE